ncbi:hypothetical protein SDC9_92084 [bioreactor metagenome]|uniref:Uncharacterized protein n=1 Tax=bioreactor metagenome TaxID=1076179 RepID=A0A644ZXB8_9ZZZZ
MGPEPRNGLQLVHRAARKAKPGAGKLGHRQPAGRRQGNQQEGDLVPHPSGAVLVHQEKIVAEGEGFS